MKKITSEKYIGDFITDSGKINETIEDRKRKAFGIAADIVAILEEFHLVHTKLKLVW